MCTDVYGESAPLDERLAAVAVMAIIGPLICVDAMMALQIRLAVETLHTLHVSLLLGWVGGLQRNHITHMTGKQTTFMQSGSGHWKGRWLHSAMV